MPSDNMERACLFPLLFAFFIVYSLDVIVVLSRFILNFIFVLLKVFRCLIFIVKYQNKNKKIRMSFNLKMVLSVISLNETVLLLLKIISVVLT